MRKTSIAEILVREGARVAAVQPLMRLDNLETRSTIALLDGQVGRWPRKRPG